MSDDRAESDEQKPIAHAFDDHPDSPDELIAKVYQREAAAELDDAWWVRVEWLEDEQRPVTDGGQSEAEVEQDDYDPSPPDHRTVNGRRVSRVANRDYASETTVYTVNNSEVFHADRGCDRIPDDAWPSAETLPHVMSSYLNPIRPCSACTMGIEHCAKVAVEHDGLDEAQLEYFEPGDKRVHTSFTRGQDGSWEVSDHSVTEVYDD